MSQIDYKFLDEVREAVEAQERFLELYRNNTLRKHLGDEIQALQVLATMSLAQAIILIKQLTPQEQIDLYHKITVTMFFGERFVKEAMSKVPGQRAQDRVTSMGARLEVYAPKLLPAIRHFVA